MTSLPWLPLESNPDIMNKFLNLLGVPEKWHMSDIVSFEEEMLDFVQKPVIAVLLLFPFSDADDKYCRQQEESTKSLKEVDSDIYFISQTIKNACGLIAVIHAIANNSTVLDLPSDSLILKFVDSTKNLLPNEKAEILEVNQDICSALKNSYPDGKSLCDKCEYHFVTFIRKNSKLYELDGRKPTPVCHGSTSDEMFLKDAMVLCEQYMKRDPDNINFTAIAFGHV